MALWLVLEDFDGRLINFKAPDVIDGAKHDIPALRREGLSTIPYDPITMAPIIAAYKIQRAQGPIAEGDLITMILAAGAMPSIVNVSTAPIDLYVSGRNGDDANDGLTPQKPLATISAANAIIPEFLAHPATIHLGRAAPGGYALSPLSTRLFGDSGKLTIIADGAGQPTETGRVTVTGQAVTAGSSSSVVNVIGPLTPNAHAGQTLEVSSGAFIGYRRIILSNTTTQITIAPLPAALNVADLIQINTSDVIINNGVAQTAFATNFQSLELVGIRFTGFDIRFARSAIDFVGCESAVELTLDRVRMQLGSDAANYSGWGLSTTQPVELLSSSITGDAYMLGVDIGDGSRADFGSVRFVGLPASPTVNAIGTDAAFFAEYAEIAASGAQNAIYVADNGSVRFGRASIASSTTAVRAERLGSVHFRDNGSSVVSTSSYAINTSGGGRVSFNGPTHTVTGAPFDLLYDGTNGQSFSLISPTAAYLSAQDGSVIQTGTLLATVPVQTDYYVDDATGDDANDGTVSAPLKTLIEAESRLLPQQTANQFIRIIGPHTGAGYTMPTFTGFIGNVAVVGLSDTTIATGSHTEPPSTQILKDSANAPFTQRGNYYEITSGPRTGDRRLIKINDITSNLNLVPCGGHAGAIQTGNTYRLFAPNIVVNVAASQKLATNCGIPSSQGNMTSLNFVNLVVNGSGSPVVSMANSRVHMFGCRFTGTTQWFFDGASSTHLGFGTENDTTTAAITSMLGLSASAYFGYGVHMAGDADCNVLNMTHHAILCAGGYSTNSNATIVNGSMVNNVNILTPGELVGYGQPTVTLGNSTQGRVFINNGTDIIPFNGYGVKVQNARLDVVNATIQTNDIGILAESNSSVKLYSLGDVTSYNEFGIVSSTNSTVEWLGTNNNFYGGKGAFSVDGVKGYPARWLFTDGESLVGPTGGVIVRRDSAAPVYPDTTTDLHLYVSDVNGNDLSGSGREATSPVATIQEAIDRLPERLDRLVVIHAGKHSGGGYDVPYFKTRILAKDVVLIGDGAGQAGEDGFVEVLTGTVDAATTVSNEIVVSGGGLTAGALRGKTIVMTSGAYTGRRRLIKDNDTTTIRCTNFVPFGPSSLAPGDSFRVVDNEVVIQTKTLGNPDYNGGASDNRTLIAPHPTTNAYLASFQTPPSTAPDQGDIAKYVFAQLVIDYGDQGTGFWNHNWSVSANTLWYGIQSINGDRLNIRTSGNIRIGQFNAPSAWMRNALGLGNLDWSLWGWSDHENGFIEFHGVDDSVPAFIASNNLCGVGRIFFLWGSSWVVAAGHFRRGGAALNTPILPGGKTCTIGVFNSDPVEIICGDFCVNVAQPGADIVLGICEITTDGSGGSDHRCVGSSYDNWTLTVGGLANLTSLSYLIGGDSGGRPSVVYWGDRFNGLPTRSSGIADVVTDVSIGSNPIVDLNAALPVKYDFIDYAGGYRILRSAP